VNASEILKFVGSFIFTLASEQSKKKLISSICNLHSQIWIWKLNSYFFHGHCEVLWIDDPDKFDLANPRLRFNHRGLKRRFLTGLREEGFERMLESSMRLMLKGGS
jgi:hypothetical protein